MLRSGPGRAGARTGQSFFRCGDCAEGALESADAIQSLGFTAGVNEAVRLITDEKIPFDLGAHLFGLLLSPLSVFVVVLVFMVFFLVLCCSSCPSPFACERPPAGAASGSSLQRAPLVRPPAEKRSVEGDGQGERQMQDDLNNATTRQDSGSGRERTWSPAVERSELTLPLARSGVSARREWSGAIGLAARVGERVAEKRTGQRAQRSVGERKLPREPRGASGVSACFADEGWRGERKPPSLRAGGKSFLSTPLPPKQKKAGGLFDRQPVSVRPGAVWAVRQSIHRRAWPAGLTTSRLLRPKLVEFFQSSPSL